MITLYYATNTCALASHIALEEAGADYSIKRVSFSQNEQRSAEYLAINPKGRVPAIVTQHGILTETPALLAFIAQSYPQSGLAPLYDPFAFARVQPVSVCDAACRACAPYAGNPLGRRSGCDRRHAAQGPADRRRLL
ncbi:MAG TPA: glutathione S-transferase N-terminal domain-containing protein [Acetobacteraceae bacterium]|jgi:glutathione S-transferase